MIAIHPARWRCIRRMTAKLATDDQSSREDDAAGILAAAAGGDQEAWREVIRRYSRRVYALIYSKCRSGDLAEEITQGVFVTVAEKLGSGGYAEQGKFEPWLFRIAVNRVRDEVRRQKRRGPRGDPGELDRVVSPAIPVSTADPRSLAALRVAMETLGEADREIIQLRHHAGLTFKQLVDVLDEPMGTLLARHHRALRKLRAVIEQHIESSSGAAPRDTHATPEAPAPLPPEPGV